MEALSEGTSAFLNRWSESLSSPQENTAVTVWGQRWHQHAKPTVPSETMPTASTAATAKPSGLGFLFPFLFSFKISKKGAPGLWSHHLPQLAIQLSPRDLAASSGSP